VGVDGEAQADSRPVFISHASRDVELVSALVDMLRVGVGLRDEEHFCSNLPGTSVKPGQDFVERIRTELFGTVLAIEIVTPSYLESKFCLCELGGLWVTMKQNFPLLVAPCRHEDLTGVLGSVHAPYIEEGLDDLAEAVAAAVGRKPGLASWSKAKSQFVDRWPELKQRIKDRAQVPREEYDRVLTQAADLEGRLRAAEQAIRAATQLGEKYNFLLTVLPELIRGLNDVLFAPDAYALRNAASDLEYMTAFHAAHLYDRHDLRSVVWHEQNGHLRRGKAVGAWGAGQPELDRNRERRLYQGPLQHCEDVWVDDPAAAEHAETAELGSGDKGYPSFLLASILAGDRNYGLLQLEAAGGPPLNADDLGVVSRLAALLATALSVLAQRHAGPAISQKASLRDASI
jgi:hypothetical protein